MCNVACPLGAWERRLLAASCEEAEEMGKRRRWQAPRGGAPLALWAFLPCDLGTNLAPLLVG